MYYWKSLVHATIQFGETHVNITKGDKFEREETVFFFTYPLIREFIQQPLQNTVPKKKIFYILLQLVNEQFKCKFLCLLSWTSWIPSSWFPSFFFSNSSDKIFQNVNTSIWLQYVVGYLFGFIFSSFSHWYRRCWKKK